ncbi:MAG: SLC13 family permease [Propionibacteriaceae bacterium]|nr:SLC13 family permease [Propionibacteriaceae bacterium]
MSTGWAEIVAIVVLVGVLVFAVTRPKGWPEAYFAVPAALVLCLIGVIGWGDAATHLKTMVPTLVFLAGILLLAHLCQTEGLFDWLGHLVARRAGGRPTRLLGWVVTVAAVTTAVLSLDATIVLLTPVVFVTASRAGRRPKPYAYATSHLANSASLLLPVSNLTNLLALSALGLSFTKFAALMGLPWLVAIAVEFVCLRLFFRADLSVAAPPQAAPPASPAPVFALVALGLTLIGFVVCDEFGLPPFWAAWAASLVIGVRQVVRARGRPASALLGDAKAVDIPFLLFVAALSVVVQAVVTDGAAADIARLIPSGHGLGTLLLLAVMAAVLANIVNNLPAILILLPLAAPLGPVAMLACLIGVNIGPNLTYFGSLATLLWRRIVAHRGEPAGLGEFTRLGALTVPISLVGCTIALWATASWIGA